MFLYNSLLRKSIRQYRRRRYYYYKRSSSG